MTDIITFLVADHCTRNGTAAFLNIETRRDISERGWAMWLHERDAVTRRLMQEMPDAHGNFLQEVPEAAIFDKREWHTEAPAKSLRCPHNETASQGQKEQGHYAANETRTILYMEWTAKLA